MGSWGDFYGLLFLYDGYLDAKKMNRVYTSQTIFARRAYIFVFWSLISNDFLKMDQYLLFDDLIKNEFKIKCSGFIIFRFRLAKTGTIVPQPLLRWFYVSLFIPTGKIIPTGSLRQGCKYRFKKQYDLLISSFIVS